MKRLFLLTIIALILSVNAVAQTKLTANTLKIDKETKPPRAEVSVMNWLAGSWTGEAFGGQVKEVWTKTGTGEMMGMFVLVQKNKPAFYEFLILTIVDDQLKMRLKHFNPDMTGWEEKDKTVDFRFIKNENNRYYFHGLTFEVTGKDSFKIYLAMRQKDKSLTEEVLVMKRAN
jgi:hypothetical protein